MTEVGLRDLRQNASDLVRRVEAGERFTVTVSGRPAAQLAPLVAPRWRQWDEVASIFRTPADQGWAQDRELPQQDLRDPWGAE